MERRWFFPFHWFLLLLGGSGFELACNRPVPPPEAPPPVYLKSAYPGIAAPSGQSISDQRKKVTALIQAVETERKQLLALDQKLNHANLIPAQESRKGELATEVEAAQSELAGVAALTGNENPWTAQNRYRQAQLRYEVLLKQYQVLDQGLAQEQSTLERLTDQYFEVKRNYDESLTRYQQELRTLIQMNPSG